MRTHLASSLVLLVSCLGAAACGNADPGSSTGSTQLAVHGGPLVLHQTHKAVEWSATADLGPADASQPDVCAAAHCAEFTLHVDLPRNVWHHPGGVQVAIRWPSDDNALDLYVYKDGAQVGAGEGFLAAEAETVRIPNAENGDYKIYVLLDGPDSLDTSVAFDALARVQYDPRVEPVRPLLPDLQARAQDTFTFDTPSFPFFEPDPPAGATCFDSEVAEDGAHTCLRFDQNIANVGEGPLELRFAVPKDPSDTSHNAFQRTYFSDGPSHYVDTPAGTWEWHEAHHHYHWDNFAVSNLWASDAQGHRVGAAPLRSGRKVSFCVEDEGIDGTKWGKSGVANRTYRAPDCLFTVTSDQFYDYLVQGLSAGWLDTYQWYLPGQYIEVSGVPDGDYVVDTIADPDGKVVESNERDNCVSVRIRLTNMGTPQRHVEMLGAGPRCTDK